MKKLLLFLMLFILIIPIAIAQPPVTITQQFTEGYIIEATTQEYVKQNTAHIFNFFVYNISNGVQITNTSSSCVFYMANTTGGVLINAPAKYIGYWNVNIAGSNFSEIGIKPYGVKCNDTNLGGAVVSDFIVTPSGKNPSQSNNSIPLVIAIGIVIIVLVMLAIQLDREHFLLKLLCLFFISALFLVLGNIGIFTSAGMIFETSGEIFMKVMSWWLRIFIIYIVMYFVYVSWFKFIIKDIMGKLGKK